MYWLTLYLTPLTYHVFDTALVSMSKALRDSTELTESALEILAQRPDETNSDALGATQLRTDREVL